MNGISYICVKPYKGKSIIGTDVEIPVGAELFVDKDILCYIYKEKQNTSIIPVCYQHSQIAHDYFIWNNSFEERKEIMEKINSLFPLNAEQTKETWDSFKFLLNENCEDSIIFSKYYYFGSFVSELKNYYDRMISLKN